MYFVSIELFVHCVKHPIDYKTAHLMQKTFNTLILSDSNSLTLFFFSHALLNLMPISSLISQFNLGPLDASILIFFSTKAKYLSEKDL